MEMKERIPQYDYEVERGSTKAECTTGYSWIYLTLSYNHTYYYDY